MRTPSSPRIPEHGMTVIELLIVIAIIGGFAYIAASGFRFVTKADLVDDATRLSAIMRRTSQLAMETGQLHRVVLDLDERRFTVEACEGATSVRRGETDPPLEERARADALEMARERMKTMMGEAATMAPATPESELARASALAGQQIGSSVCAPVEGVISGDAEGRDLSGTLRVTSGIKFKEVWVQHADESFTSGTAAIHFFPIGSAEKAIVSLTDGTDGFTVKIHGLTGRIELRDGDPERPEDHMNRNAEGDREAER
jgi:prepilin-type N-terminal cleavage/methylation domain-containing protein